MTLMVSSQEGADSDSDSEWQTLFAAQAVDIGSLVFSLFFLSTKRTEVRVGKKIIRKRRRRERQKLEKRESAKAKIVQSVARKKETHVAVGCSVHGRENKREKR